MRYRSSFYEDSFSDAHMPPCCYFVQVADVVLGQSEVHASLDEFRSAVSQEIACALLEEYGDVLSDGAVSLPVLTSEEFAFQFDESLLPMEFCQLLFLFQELSRTDCFDGKSLERTDQIVDRVLFAKHRLCSRFRSQLLKALVAYGRAELVPYQ